MVEHTEQVDLDDIFVTSITASERRCPACDIVVPQELERCPNDGTVLAAPPQTELSARYDFLEPIGKGGMSVVYKARHKLMGNVVAIKLLQDKLTENVAYVKRFQVEAQAAGKLDHSNLIKVTDFGVLTSGFTYLVMDYLDGESLADIIKNEGRMSGARALPLFQQICDGLAHAHSKGILHRDLKPSNIIVTEGQGETRERAKVVDFGIAKVTAEDGQHDHKLTATGEVFGSPHYMSPEQCTGGEVDRRSDLYSMGCLMYEVLTGRTPFAGSNVFEVIHKQVSETPDALGKLVDRDPLAHALSPIVMKALEKDPKARYQSFDEMSADLKKVSEGKKLRVAWRGKLLATGIAASAVLAIGVVGIVGIAWKQPAPPPAVQKTPVTPSLPKVVLPTPHIGFSADEEAYYKTKNVVDLRYRNLDPADIVRLGANRNAEKIEIPGNARITTADLEPLRGMPNLKALDLAGTAVDNKVFELCATMPQLEYLVLSGTKVTSDGFKQLGKIPKLQQLVIGDLDLSDSDLRKLPVLPTMIWLRLDDNPRLTDAAMPILLQKVPNLERLTIRRNPGITDGAVASLVKFKRLAELKVLGSNLTFVPGVRTIRQLCPDLKITFDAYVDPGTHEYDRKLVLGTLAEQISRSTPSKFDHEIVDVRHAFEASGPELKDSDVIRVAANRNAKFVRLSNSPNVTMKSLQAFRSHPAVELLVGGTAADDSLMEVVATMPHLKKLDVSNTKVTVQGLRRIATLPHLRELWIADMNLTDKDIKRLPMSMTLHTLKLDGNPLTDACMKDVAERFPKVNFLTVRRTGITDGAIPAILRLGVSTLGSEGSKITAQGKRKLTDAHVKVKD